MTAKLGGALAMGLAIGLAAMLLMGAADNRYPRDFGYSLTGPGTGVFAPTQHDTNELTYVARAIIAETSGDIKFKAVDGTSITMTFQAGQQVSCQAVQIFDTGTTLADSDIVCLK